MKLQVYNKTLDPSLWNDDKTLKPEIREHLLQIAEDFYNSTELTGDVQNILFIGSSANYNWTPTSDIDLHIVIDVAQEKINEDYSRKFMDSLSFKWNTEHEIEIKNHPIEVYLQDLREPNSDATKGRPGAAIYSLYDGKWLIEPKHEIPQIDPEKIRQKYQVIKNKIKNLVQTEDITKLKDLMKSIRNYRNAGLSKGGEFSTENLVFKALRKGGELASIKDTINSIYDKKASLPEHGNFQPSTGTTKMNESVVKTKPFNIVGFIKHNSYVNSKIDYRNSSIIHEELPEYKFGDTKWRYSSLKNTVYWLDSGIPTKEEEHAVENHLDKKYSIVDPKQVVSVRDYFKYGHGYGLDESLDKTKPYHIIGVISPNLEVHSIIDYSANNGHHRMPEWSREYSKRWRYSSLRNTIYWMSKEEVTTSEEKEEVKYYLDKKYAIVNPKQESSTYGYFMFGHELKENKLKSINEHFIDRKAALYLGFVNRNTFKVIGTDVDDDSMTHATWQRGLPNEYQWYYGSQALLWRYKRNTNTVYWWSLYDSPNDEERQSVEDWLFKNANIKYPHHKMISWDRDNKSINRRLAAHSIGSDYDGDDEFVD